MRSWFRNSFAGLCLLLALAFAILWVRSYWVMDQWTRERLEPKIDQVLTFRSARGRLILHRAETTSPPLARPSTRRTSYTRSDPRQMPWPAEWFEWNARGVSGPGGMMLGERWLVLPHAVPVLASLLPAAWVIWAARRRRRVLLHEGLCPSCGYDLRATPHRCPECGTELPGLIAA